MTTVFSFGLISVPLIKLSIQFVNPLCRRDSSKSNLMKDSSSRMKGTCVNSNSELFILHLATESSRCFRLDLFKPRASTKTFMVFLHTFVSLKSNFIFFIPLPLKQSSFPVDLEVVNISRILAAWASEQSHANISMTRLEINLICEAASRRSLIVTSLSSPSPCSMMSSSTITPSSLCT